MSDALVQCWLEDAQGRRTPVGRRGLIVGRNLGADLMLDDAAASRRAAFVYQDLEGLWLVRVGRSSVRVGSVEVEETQRLNHGDQIDFPGASFLVHAQQDEALYKARWVLRREAAPAELSDLPRVAPLGQGPFTMGGGPGDSLQVAPWPPGLVRLVPSGDAWLATLGQGVSIDGIPVRARFTRELGADSRVGFGGVVYRLVDVAAVQRDTEHRLPVEMPTRAVLQPLVPSGGSLTLGFGEVEVTTWIPGVRFDLLQALLTPPEPYGLGDPLPDAVVLPRVWGRKIPTGRKAVVTVLMRLRRDLDKGGLPGALLVERSTGRSRFRLAPGAQVEILDPR